MRRAAKVPVVVDPGTTVGVRERPFGIQFGARQLKGPGKLKPWQQSGTHFLAGATRRLAVKEQKYTRQVLSGTKKIAATVQKSPSRSAATEGEIMRTVYVGSVPLHWTKKQLLEALEISAPDVDKVRFKNLPIEFKYRHLGHVAVRKKLFTGTKTVKDAFVTVKEKENISRLLNCNGKRVEDPHSLESLRLVVTTRSVKKDFSIWGTKAALFVGNLHSMSMESHLWDKCDEILGEGSVKNVRIMRDTKTFASKCCGFVRFKDKRTARLALTKLNGIEIKGRPMHVTEALTKEEAEENDARKSQKMVKHIERRLKYKEAKRQRNKRPVTPSAIKEKHAKRRRIAESKSQTEVQRPGLELKGY